MITVTLSAPGFICIISKAHTHTTESRNKVGTVIYLPTTRPGCQNRKCTYVNNRCIQSRNSSVALTVDGWMSAICDAHKKVDVELLYNSVQLGDQTSWREDAEEKARTQQRESSGPRLSSLEIRPVGEKMLEWEHVPERLGPQAPGWAAQENRKETRLWPIEWVSICCSSVRSPTPSHTQPFNKGGGIFF